MANADGQNEMSDRTDAAPLTTERRYGIYRAGLAAAAVLIVVLAGAGIALIFGVRDATILLCILLPLMLMSAVFAHVFLWWQHKRAMQRREVGADWVSASYDRQTQAQPSAIQETARNSGSSWFGRFSQRSSTRSTPPPGYQTVLSA